MNNDYTPAPVKIQSMFCNGHLVLTHCTEGAFLEQVTTIATAIKEQDVAEIIHEYNNANKVGAIKQFRTLSGWYLKESKETVEYLVDRYVATVTKSYTLDRK